MAPGMPTETAEAQSQAAEPVKKPVEQPSSSPEPMFPPSSLSALAETLEEVRDEMSETEAVKILCEKLSQASRATEKLWSFSRAAAWVLGTSALILVVPLLYEIDKEVGPGFDPSAIPDATSGSEGAAAQTAVAVDTDVAGKS